VKKFDITTEAHALELEGENVVSKRGCGLGHGPGIGLLREVNVERCAEEGILILFAMLRRFHRVQYFLVIEKSLLGSMVGPLWIDSIVE